VAKLKDTRIGPPELIKFLSTSSDFGFELRCLERLGQLGFRCQHGGSYVDRVTNKARQFDIRALKQDRGNMLRIRCAVECKNLAESFPLLIMCVPRSLEESFHELVISYDPASNTPFTKFDNPIFRKNCQIIRVGPPISDYTPGTSVGKSSVQVGLGQDNVITANDAEVFEKWSQALASAQDLADEAAEEGERQKELFISLVLPILVVPNGTLWKVDYSDSGSRCGDPINVDRCSFFVGRDYSAGDRIRGGSLTLSHLEFVTIAGLEQLTGSMPGQNSPWFPSFDVLGTLASQQSRR
jgi:hypothetical protein